MSAAEAPTNEIRVAATQSLSTVIQRALAAFKTHDLIVVRGLGGAISGAVQCAEVVRHRIAGVQMVIDVTSVTNEDKGAKREKTSAVRILQRIQTTINYQLTQRRPTAYFILCRQSGMVSRVDSPP